MIEEIIKKFDEIVHCHGLIPKLFSGITTPAVLEQIEGIDRFSRPEDGREYLKIACIAPKSVECEPGLSITRFTGTDHLEFKVKGAICKNFATQDLMAIIHQGAKLKHGNPAMVGGFKFE